MQSFWQSKPCGTWHPLLTASLFAAIAALGLAACHHVNNPSPMPEIDSVGLGSLPAEARFITLGDIGQAYRLTASGPVEGRFPISPDTLETLLLATIRLFRFDEMTGDWLEIADSYYDAQTNEIVGKDLVSGLYTAVGWSANPAENVMQRIVFDWSNGFGPFFDDAQLQEEPADNQTGFDHPRFRTSLVQNWIYISFSLRRTTCETIDEEGCPRPCRRLAGRRKLSSCPVECPEPDCCECQEFTWTERALIPADLFQAPPPLCRPGQGPCPLCPNGLSCPSGPSVDTDIIKPTLSVPDYAFMTELGLGALVEDVVLRDDLHALVETIVGTEYPIPPPWN